MRPLQITLRRTFSGFWTAFQTLLRRFSDACRHFGTWHSPGSQKVYNKLSDHTKVNVYKACVISTLLYGGESWTMHAHQEKRLNVFHMRCLGCILGITWQDKVTNKMVLEKAGITSLYTLLKQMCMRWLGHVTRMKDGRIPKDLLYGELATGKRPTGRPQLRFRTYASETSRHLA